MTRFWSKFTRQFDGPSHDQISVLILESIFCDFVGFVWLVLSGKIALLIEDQKHPDMFDFAENFRVENPEALKGKSHWLRAINRLGS